MSLESKQFYCRKCADKWQSVMTPGVQSRWEDIVELNNLCGDWLLLDETKLQGTGCRRKAEKVFIRTCADPVYISVNAQPFLTSHFSVD